MFQPSPRLENLTHLEVRRLRRIDLSSVQLRGVRLSSCDLRGANLAGADLREIQTGFAWQRLVFALFAVAVGYAVGAGLAEATGFAVLGFWGAIFGFDAFWASSLDDRLPENIYPPGDARRESRRPAESAAGSGWHSRLPLVLAAGALLQAAWIWGLPISPLQLATQPLGALLGLAAASLVAFAYARCWIPGTSLREADLTAADLSDASLVRADLRCAVLSRARLVGADLRGADLRGANFAWADLADADLQGARLEQTCFDEAIMPDRRRFSGELANHRLHPEI